MIRLSLLVILILFPSNAFATEELAGPGEITFPFELNDSNFSVRFEVDSTWHFVEGTTQGAQGRVWLEDPAQESSLRAEARLPVQKFDTGNSMRDDRMREVMNSDRFPEVRFLLDTLDERCLPRTLVTGRECDGEIRGRIRIRDVERVMRIPIRLRAEESQFVISGTQVLRWSEYGVEDPSIFIAKLDEQVRIHFNLRCARLRLEEK